MQELFGNLWNLQWQQVVMWGIGGLLIWLAIKKEMEPSLLLPMGFRAILVNLPLSGAVTQVLSTWASRSARWMCCLMLALPTNCSRCCCLWALVQ